MRGILVGLSVFTLTAHAYANTQVITNNTITVLTQGSPDSNAHIIASNQALPRAGQQTGCYGNFVYIDIANKEMLATAITLSMNNKLVNIAYDDAAAPNTSPPWGATTCRLVSIWPGN
jgi:hypothetical protein